MGHLAGRVVARAQAGCGLAAGMDTRAPEGMRAQKLECQAAIVVVVVVVVAVVVVLVVVGVVVVVVLLLLVAAVVVVGGGRE